MGVVGVEEASESADERDRRKRVENASDDIPDHRKKSLASLLSSGAC